MYWSYKDQSTQEKSFFSDLSVKFFEEKSFIK